MGETAGKNSALAPRNRPWVVGGEDRHDLPLQCILRACSFPSATPHRNQTYRSGAQNQAFRVVEDLSPLRDGGNR